MGQEVIVDFLNGDPDQPIIMGRTYHEDNRSPGDLPGTKTQMTIRSKTYKGSGFNELRFEDATSNEQVYIHAQKNMDTEVLNDRTTDVKHDHTETIGNDQKITVVKGQTVQVGTRKEGGHDQSITVANDRCITVRNDQTLQVTNDRTVSVSNDDGLYVRNDRKVTVEGKQEHKTTGNHVSLVEGKHSLVVKGGPGEEGEWRAGDKGGRGNRAGEQQPDKPESGWFVCGHPFRGAWTSSGRKSISIAAVVRGRRCRRCNRRC